MILNENLSLLFVGASLDAIKRKLTEAEALEAAAGNSLPHKLHPSSFVRMGLDIEDQQYELAFHCTHSTFTHMIQTADH